MVLLELPLILHATQHLPETIQEDQSFEVSYYLPLLLLTVNSRTAVDRNNLKKNRGVGIPGTLS